jgi:hypothetical protein
VLSCNDRLTPSSCEGWGHPYFQTRMTPATSLAKTGNAPGFSRLRHPSLLQIGGTFRRYGVVSNANQFIDLIAKLTCHFAATENPKPGALPEAIDFTIKFDGRERTRLLGKTSDPEKAQINARPRRFL